MKVELQDRIAFLRLTNEGIGALHDLVPSGTGFSAFVLEEKSYGLWIIPEGSDKLTEDVWTLVRWNYLEAITLLPKGVEPNRKK
jgi:hypothetical protein